jgi:2-polyprenyl-6-methoxyphenol hydroxylase-like FAD-dependent oxidoreductase
VDRACVERVVIVGCGIAGPVLGMFLRRLGVEVVICEGRREEAKDEGAFLGLAPNGMNVLAELSVHRDIEAIGVPCSGFAFQNSRGQPIGAIDRRQDDELFGARLQMVRRAQLHQVLTQKAQEHGVEVHFGRPLVGIDQDESGVVGHFSDGSSLRGDALVGCDGLRSTTRKLALPSSPAPAYSGLVDYGGFAPCPAAPLEQGVNVMVFGRRAFFGAFRTPAGEVWWFHNSGENSPQQLERDPSAQRARILELHREDPAWIADVVRATPTLLGPWPLHDILSMPRWSSGRVCLIGDAAHATTPSAGQGASLAVEDAMVLARCLRDAPDPQSAFGAFERARRARVEEIVAQSRRTGNTKAVSGPVQEWFRDRMLPLFLRLGARAQNRAYAHRIAWQVNP